MGTSADRTAEYHVEHREDGRRAIIAVGTPLLAPIANRLVAQGKRGYLAVVHAETGELVIRCPIAPDEPANSAGT
ncbi:MAG TPA: hypothetical protein VH482_26940 [Thermomicrobiales bacterium]